MTHPQSLPFVDDVEGCSRAGAEHALPKAGSQLAMVYAELQRGPKTDRELVQATGLPINVICARRWSLTKSGLVEAVGKVAGLFGTPNTLWGVVRVE